MVDDRRKRGLSISSQCRLGQAARRLVIQGGWLAKWIGKTPPREGAVNQPTKAGIDFTGTIDHVAGMMQEIMEEVGATVSCSSMQLSTGVTSWECATGVG